MINKTFLGKFKISLFYFYNSIVILYWADKIVSSIDYDTQEFFHDIIPLLPYSVYVFRRILRKETQYLLRYIFIDLLFFILFLLYLIIINHHKLDGGFGH